MSISINGLRETRAMLNNVERFLRSTKPMKAITEDVKERVEERTAKGRDYKNRKFKPYSLAYAKKKKKTLVNLKDSGEMLGALRTQVINPKHGRVLIKGRRAIIANIHTTGTGKQPERDFMNITKTGEAKIVKEHYDDPLLKILRRGK